MSSGGGKASTPKLLNDNLKSKQYYKVLDLISEGPIFGPIDQTHLSSFLINKTPITSANGDVNINGVTVAWRPGSETQSPINGFSAIEATTIINTDVTQATPLVRTVTDVDVTRVRFNVGVSSLVEQDSKGNQKETSVTLVLETRVGNAAWNIAETVTITGKQKGEYLEAHVINAPDTKPFDIRVRRITPDSTVDTLVNGTIWNSYVEITDDNLNYPFSAISGSVIDRDQYTDTPSRTYHLRGLIVDVPDNYDPINRTYSGLWTGGFKSAWTNNPAWLFRALVKNNRYGLSRRAGYIDVDDGSLYILSQYCDQLVDDGYGGREPRMTLNAYITEQASARNILDNIAGMFRGIALWDGMRLAVSIDAPQDPIAAITNANVVDGTFIYSSTKRSDRFNAVVVSWTDPDNGWEQQKEYVSDDDLIARFEYNETTLEAFGCTSRGQAWRAGKWLLETAKRETKKVQFQMARDAIAFTPGDIIELMDNNYAAARLGGRIISHAAAVITVDADVSALAGSGDSISLVGANGKLVKYEIKSVSGRAITLKTTPAWVRDGTVFVISTGQLATRLFRIIGIAEADNNSVYTITAAQHDPNKQAIVDEGAVFEIPNDTLNGYRVPNIENLRIINTNSETVQVTATWETATTTKKIVFELYVYTLDGKVVAQYETDQFRYDFYGIDAGEYSLGVRGRNENGMKGRETQITLLIGAPPKPSSVTWTPGYLSSTLEPQLSVSRTADTTFEFWTSGVNEITNPALIETNATFLGRGSQWTLVGIKFNVTYYAYVRTRNSFGVSDFVQASGKASDDVEGTLEMLTGMINETQLAQDLLSKINNAITEEELADVRSDIGETKGRLGSLAEGVLNNIIAIKDNDELIRELSAQTGQNVATIYQKLQVLTSADSAFAQQLDVIGAQMANNTAAITTEQTARVEGDLALASRITLLGTSVGDNSAAILAEQTARVEGDTANAQAITDLSTTVGQNTAQITNLSEVVSDISGSVATQLDGVNASNHNNSEANLFQAVSEVLADASVTTLTKSVANNEVASAQKIETLTAQLNDTKAQVQQTSQAMVTVNNKIDVSYSVKLGVTSGGAYVATGFSIGLSNETGEIQSQFLVSADRFAILPSSTGGTVSSAVSPFIVSGGEVLINKGFIGQAWIGRGNITDTLQSDNYVQGLSGLNINFKTGDMEINGNVPGQGRSLLNNEGLKFWNENNYLIIELGKFS